MQRPIHSVVLFFCLLIAFKANARNPDLLEYKISGQADLFSSPEEAFQHLMSIHGGKHHLIISSHEVSRDYGSSGSSYHTITRSYNLIFWEESEGAPEWFVFLNKPRQLLSGPNPCQNFGGAFESNSSMSHLHATGACVTPEGSTTASVIAQGRKCSDTRMTHGVNPTTKYHYAQQTLNGYGEPHPQTAVIKISGHAYIRQLDAQCSTPLIKITLTEYSWYCSIAPLTELTDPAAIAMEENPNSPDVDNLNGITRQGAECIQSQVASNGGSSSIQSGYRPQQYQRHLREVWDKKELFDRLPNDTKECTAIRNKVTTEFNQHGLIRRPAFNSNHSAGNSVDISIRNPGANIDQIASQCGMHRPEPVTDRVHFTPTSN